ncbi:MAG: glycosyltransferase [Bacteroidetes bacterium]|nr:glycosyltransferase [Bacteroidota bacterium]
MKKIALILSALKPGGAERVMTELARIFSTQEGIKTYLLLMTKGDKFYTLPPNVEIIEPDFKFLPQKRLVSTIKSFFYVRKSLKEIKPDSALSFSGRFNAFVILCAWRLGIKIFISDRSRPGISYGRFLDIFNPIIYKKASGIIAQTTEAQMICRKATHHKNIEVISNPIRTLDLKPLEKEKIILNVGRFIKSKKQEWLIDYFDQISNEDWSLVFLGDGPELRRVKKYAKEKAIARNIHFLGTSKNVDFYYSIASIFAFTSVSEGFPNALGEAMAAGLACISFDCSSGHSEIFQRSKKK